MRPKSGKPGLAVSPAAPANVLDADSADPGEVAAVRSQEIQAQSGKYGSSPAPPFKRAKPSKPSKPSKPATEEDSSRMESWIEIELVGEDDGPIPGEQYRITLPDGSVAEGTLDNRGLARVEGFEDGSCQVTFPSLDKTAWEKI